MSMSALTDIGQRQYHNILSYLLLQLNENIEKASEMDAVRKAFFSFRWSCEDGEISMNNEQPDECRQFSIHEIINGKVGVITFLIMSQFGYKVRPISL